MSAHTVVAVLSTSTNYGVKRTTFTATLSASYDAGGSVIDLSTSGVLGVEAGFTVVHSCKAVAVAIGGAANDVYYHTYVPATAYAAATGLVKVRDMAAAADAEASGNLSAVAVIYEATGR